jgi:hypothetical protein
MSTLYKKYLQMFAKYDMKIPLKFAQLPLLLRYYLKSCYLKSPFKLELHYKSFAKI